VLLLSCSNQAQETDINRTTNENTKINNSNTNQFDVAEFERNRDLWTSKNIRNYKMIVGAHGLLTNFPEEVLIEVQNRKTKSIKSLSKTGRNYVEAYQPFSTVEKLFDFIEQAKKADKLEVGFDENLGHPTRITYDGSFGTADDELSLWIKSLEVIK
jgi:Family of unknown function (DUF6174)